MPVAVSMLAWILIAAALLLPLLTYRTVRLWARCVTTSAGIGFLHLIGMRLRRVDARVIVESRIAAVHAGLHVPVAWLEGHFLAGGDVRNVVRALIAADRAKVPLDFEAAAAVDLAGRDVLAEVQERAGTDPEP